MESRKSRTAPNPRFIRHCMAERCDSSISKRDKPSSNIINYRHYIITHRGEIYDNSKGRYVEPQYRESQEVFVVSIYAENGERITKTRNGWKMFYYENGGKEPFNPKKGRKRK